MKARNREVNIFNMSLLDILCGALGAFCFISLTLFPYYGKNATMEQLQELQKKLEDAQKAAGKGNMSGVVQNLQQQVQQYQAAWKKETAAYEEERENAWGWFWDSLENLAARQPAGQARQQAEQQEQQIEAAWQKCGTESSCRALHQQADELRKKLEDALKAGARQVSALTYAAVLFMLFGLGVGLGDGVRLLVVLVRRMVRVGKRSRSRTQN